MKKKGKIIIGLLVGVSVVAAAAFAGYKIMQSVDQGGNSSGPETVLKLETPQHLSFDQDNYILSWSDVAHADGYKVDVNGHTVNVSDNEYYYVPYTENTTFKVQAYDSTREYKDSDWSSAYNYTISTEAGVNNATFNKYVADAVPGYTFEKVVSLYGDGSNVYGKAVFSGKLFDFIFCYNHEVESLEQVVVNNDREKVRNMGEYSAKDFDTVNYYMQASSLGGQLQEYKDQGYQITPVSSQAYEVSNSRIGLAGVYKLTLGDEVKYVASEVNFVIMATDIEGERYTNLVKDIDPYYIREIDCHEIDGDFVDAITYYAEEANNVQNQNMAYTTNYTYNDGGWGV